MAARRLVPFMEINGCGANECVTFAGFCVWVTGTTQRTHNRVSLGIIKQKQLLRITRLVGLKALGHHLGQEQVEWVSIQRGAQQGVAKDPQHCQEIMRRVCRVHMWRNSNTESLEGGQTVKQVLGP